MQPIELTDGVVRLRLPDADDVDRVTALCQDAAIQQFTTVPSPYLRDDGEVFVTRVVPGGWQAGTSLNWSVRDAATDILVGMIGLEMHPARSAEAGYWLGAEARGRGTAGRALDLVIDWAFDPTGLGLDRLTWVACSANLPSRRVAERAGFHVEGHIRGQLLQRGVRHDAWVGTLLAGDERPRR